jgi:hypothetical protein
VCAYLCVRVAVRGLYLLEVPHEKRPGEVLRLHIAAPIRARAETTAFCTPSHTCPGTGLTPATSAPELGSPRPHLRRDLALRWGKAVRRETYRTRVPPLETGDSFWYSRGTRGVLEGYYGVLEGYYGVLKGYYGVLRCAGQCPAQVRAEPVVLRLE